MEIDIINNKSRFIASDPNHSCFVVAHAGTGKTKLLVDRVLRLLLNGVQANKILCITFTNAAAFEMKDRIYKKLSFWASAPDNNIIEDISQLTSYDIDYIIKNAIYLRAKQLFLLLIDDAKSFSIKTIHSLCQSILHQFPMEAGLCAGFEIADYLKIKEVTVEAKNKLFHDADLYDQNSDLSLALNFVAQNLKEYGFEQLLEEALELYNNNPKINLYQNFLELAKYHENQVNIAKNKLFSDEYFGPTFLQNIEIMLTSTTKTDINNAQKMMKFCTYNFNTKLAQIKDYFEIFFTKTTNPKKLLSSKMVQLYPNLHQFLIEEQNRLTEYNNNFCLHNSLMRSSYFFIIVKYYHKHYNAIKSSNNLIEFDDIITLTKKLLNDNILCQSILYKLSNDIEHILVDEAQDTNKQQWEIISTLCADWFYGSENKNNKNSLFIVGDNKQAIYGFQGASAKLFTQMKNYFKTNFNHIKQDMKEIVMDVSFRSSKPILQLVDEILTDSNLNTAIMSSNEMIHVKHKVFFENKPGMIQLWPLVKLNKSLNNLHDDDNEEQNFSVEETKMIAAEQIANEISYWLKNDKKIFGTNKVMQAKDIMILIRKRSDFVEYLEHALKQKKIPVSGSKKVILQNNMLIMDLITLGKFVINPHDDLNLAILLKTPIFEFTENDIIDLRLENSEILLLDRLKSSQNILHQAAYKYLNYLIIMSQELNIYHFYHNILENQSMKKKFFSYFGTQGSDIIEEFLLLIIQYEKDYNLPLQDFIKWFTGNSIFANNDKYSTKNEVKIMTIHAAKGLQAPIVFLADTANIHISKKNFFYNDQENIITWPQAKYLDILSYVAKEANNNQEYCEYLRLLYVAITRAEHELYITGFSNKSNIDPKSWFNILNTKIQNLSHQKLDDDKIVILHEGQESEISNIESTNNNHHNITEIQNEVINLENNKVSIIKSDIIETDVNLLSPLFGQRTNKAKEGIIIHKLLEIIITAQNDTLQQEIILDILRNKFQIYDINEINRLTKIANNMVSNKNLLDLCANSEIFTELEILFDGKLYRIDLVVIKNDYVVIIDYKTGNNFDYQCYIKQLNLYKQALLTIYPNKIVKTLILDSKLTITEINC